MDTHFYLKGILLGFILAMSIGPIALLCISNTLKKGASFGLATAFGAATADGIYGAVAGLGLTLIASQLGEYSIYLRILGGIFLFYLGYKIISSTVSKKRIDLSKTALIKTYFAILCLTLINPTTIATFIGAFAGIGLGEINGSMLLSLILGTGVFTGSVFWHSIFLVGGSHLLRERIKTHHLIKLNKVSGFILCGFALISFLNLL